MPLQLRGTLPVEGKANEKLRILLSIGDAPIMSDRRKFEESRDQVGGSEFVR